MTENTNEQRQHPESPETSVRTSVRKIIGYAILTVVFFILAVTGFGQEGPWYVFLASAIGSGAAGVFFFRTIHETRHALRTPRS